MKSRSCGHGRHNGCTGKVYDPSQKTHVVCDCSCEHPNPVVVTNTKK